MINNLKWLLPGLKVKRWLFFATAGIIAIATGLAVIADIGIDFAVYLKESSSILLGLIAIIIGLLMVVVGLRKTVRSILSVIVPLNENKLVDTVFAKRNLKKGPKIVTIGGGTGLSVLLRGLKSYTSNITAIVTVSDDGGSSGRLRGELGILPPGDIRNCLVALADTETLMDDIFNYRFNEGAGLKGHNLGNLLLAAMTDISGDFNKATQELSRVLAIRGKVLPSTLSNVTLSAKLASGKIVRGETYVGKTSGNIEKVYLEPMDSEPLPEAVKAIMEADMIVLGPGSLYTSVIPNLLIKDLLTALKKTKAPVAYVCNVMTQPGETQGYTALQHLKAIEAHGARGLINYMIVNDAPILLEMLEKYEEKGATPVVVKEDLINRKGVEVVKASLVDQEDLVRHDSDKLARVVLQTIFRIKSNSEKVRLFDIYLNEKIKDLSD